MERDDERVLKAFRGGEFDYVDAISEVEEADFFRRIVERKILHKLAASYPTPRQRHDVPLWAYTASERSMRFRGEHHFCFREHRREWNIRVVPELRMQISRTR